MDKRLMKPVAKVCAVLPLVLGLSTAACGSDSGGGEHTVLKFPTLDVIDDLEDGDPLVPRTNGRGGAWEPFTDGTNIGNPFVFEPTELKVPRSDGVDPVSKWAMHAAGGGYTNWGAGWQVNLNSRGAYDASKFDGVTFWMRADVPAVLVKVSVPDKGSTEHGSMNCDPYDTKVGGRGCYDESPSSRSSPGAGAWRTTSTRRRSTK
jgi:hypothetical protein